MKNYLFIILLAATFCVANSVNAQTLLVDNQTNQTWTVNYNGEAITVPPGEGRLDVSTSTCGHGVTVSNNFGAGTCVNVDIRLGDNDVSGCSGGGTSNCNWSAFGQVSSPLCGNSTVYTSIIRFE